MHILTQQDRQVKHFQFLKDTKPRIYVGCERENHEIKECKDFLERNHSSRWQIVREKKICSMCLRVHRTNQCKEVSACGINGCTRKHHQLLHNINADKPINADVGPNNTHRQQEITAFFRIVPVTLYNGNANTDTFAFLDEGSSLTLVQEDLANKLGINGAPERLCLKWTSDMVRN